jgi:aminoglycoside phosphotransferase (APT) family kinase protein
VPASSSYSQQQQQQQHTEWLSHAATTSSSSSKPAATAAEAWLETSAPGCAHQQQHFLGALRTPAAALLRCTAHTSSSTS